MKTKRHKRTIRNRTTLAAHRAGQTEPIVAAFTEHLRELRRRVFWIGASIALGATLAYSVQQQIVAILLKPAGDQQFIYTTPGGGFNFLIQICIYSGILLSIPVIIYNVLKFIEPVVHASSTRYIMRGSAAAGLLAFGGVAFGYFFGLPTALQFLAHQFTTDQVTAMIAIQSYTGFVTKFLVASALIFQAPLLMLFINRIRPLKPSNLLKSEKWVILGSFIIGAVISPTPDIRSMLLMAIPMILTYQIGIALIWHVNRRGKRPKSILALLEQDAAVQAERLQRLEEAVLAPFIQYQPQPAPVTVPADNPEPVRQERPDEAAVPRPLAVSQIPVSRSDYRDSVSSQRVRRRMISSI